MDEFLLQGVGWGELNYEKVSRAKWYILMRIELRIEFSKRDKDGRIEIYYYKCKFLSDVYERF